MVEDGQWATRIEDFKLRLTCLGAFEAYLDDLPLEGFGTDKDRALLIYLAVESDRAHRREFLAGLLWPEQPEMRALHSLRQSLSKLRKLLQGEKKDSPFLLIDSKTVRINPEASFWVDTQAFEMDFFRAIQHIQNRPPGRPDVRSLQRSMALYRCHFLDQFSIKDSAPFEEWVLLTREALNQKAVQGLGLWLDILERSGEFGRAQDVAGRLVELIPWDENAHVRLMRLLAINRQWSAAQNQYMACRRYLREELNVEPAPETMDLFERIRIAAAGGTEIEPVWPATFVNLPQPCTPFVGRRRELDRLSAMLADPACRLITLLGPGGAGKTRLAFKAASEQIGSFRDGVCFVPLLQIDAPERGAAALAPAIARALDFSLIEGREIQQQVEDYLRNQQILLVLDNLEHMIQARDWLAKLIALSPQLVFLATSRQLLKLAGEWVMDIGGLEYPPQDERKTGAARTGKADRDYDSLAFFTIAAQRINPNFKIQPQDYQSIVRICRLLDGLPLGLELAAAGVRSHNLASIADRLTSNLDAIQVSWPDLPPRHRSLRAAFNHAWASLTHQAQRELACLSIFPADFSRAAAAAVAGTDEKSLETHLDRCSLQYDEMDRFSLPAALRPFTLERLQADPTLETAVQTRFVSFYAAGMPDQAVALQGERQAVIVRKMNRDNENLRLAWQLAVKMDAAAEAAVMLPALFDYYDLSGVFQEGVDLFSDALRKWSGDSNHARLHAGILARQAALQLRLGNYEQARPNLANALAVFNRAGPPEEVFFCLQRLASVLRSSGSNKEAETACYQALELAQQIGNERLAAEALIHLGIILSHTGKISAVIAPVEEGLAIVRKTGDLRLQSRALNMLGDHACYSGEYPLALQHFQEALQISYQLGDLFNLALHTNNLGTVYHEMGQFEPASRYYEESLKVCRKIGDRAGETIALSNLAELELAAGEHQVARNRLYRALLIAREINDTRAIQTCLNNLSEASLAMGALEQAEAFGKEALASARETGNLPMLVKSLLHLAVLRLAQGRQAEALPLVHFVICSPASEAWLRNQGESLRTRYQLTLPDNPPPLLESLLDELLQEQGREQA